MKIEAVLVVGSGQMGRGIAQVIAQNNIQTFLLDSDIAKANLGKTLIASGLSKLVNKNKITSDEQEKILKNIIPIDNVKNININLVIEAINENLSSKIQLFKSLNSQLERSIIFCSNTSSIRITELAAESGRPDRFFGAHFMNPVPVMELVEMIPGLQSDLNLFSDVCSWIQSLGKTIVKSQDRPGFIVNRILMPMINEAIYTLMEGVGDAKGIDDAMKLGTRQPMGPLELADFIGLDTCLSIMQVLYTGFGDSKYRPSPLLINYVKAGWLGRKSGKGFYNYN